MGNSQWEREWNGLHNWESRAHRLHEVIGTQHVSVTVSVTLVPGVDLGCKSNPLSPIHRL